LSYADPHKSRDKGLLPRARVELRVFKEARWPDRRQRVVACGGAKVATFRGWKHSGPEAILHNDGVYAHLRMPITWA
jgi:hypothetical protein